MHTPGTCGNQRRAIGTLEAVCALAIVALLVTFVGQWTAATRQHRRDLTAHRVAIQAAENVLAIAMAASYDEVTETQLDAWAAPFLPPRATWELAVREETDEEPAGKRLAIRVRYNNAPRVKVAPLVAFRYREEQAP